MSFIPNTAVYWSYQTYRDYRQYGTTEAEARLSAEDFYGGRTGSLEKFYLFFVNDFGWRFLRWPDGAIRKILFIYLFILIFFSFIFFLIFNFFFFSIFFFLFFFNFFFPLFFLKLIFY